MNTYIVQFIIIFLVSIAVIELFFFASRSSRLSHRGKVIKKLKTFSLNEPGTHKLGILRTRVLSHVPFLNKILFRLPVIRSLESLIQQANAQFPPGVYILFSLILALTGYASCSIITKNFLIAIIVAVCAAGLPFLVLRLNKQKRMQKFEKQLPEGLELVARSLRAGHSFQGGIQEVGSNFDDPLGTEFEKILAEINFGLSVQDALKNLTNRVDCPDIKYFVVSVILQRETGGNLAEIMESIARIIRERFKFKDKVRVLSAESKLSAIILICIPFFVVITLWFLNPDYIATLINEPAGRLMSGIAVFMMLLGVIVMKRVINIDL
jgi:tight adherence protein B